MARLSHLLTKCTPCTFTEAPVASSPISSAPLSSEAILTTSSKFVTSHIGTGENPEEYGESYQFTPKPLQRHRGRIAPRIFTNAPALISSTAHLPNIRTNLIDVALPSETTKTSDKSSSSESSSSESHETKPSYGVQEFTKEAVEPESKAEPTKKSDENFIEELPKIGNTVTDLEPAAFIAPRLITTTSAYVTPQVTTTTSESIQTSGTSTEQSVEIIPSSTEPTIAQELTTTTASSFITPSVNIGTQIGPSRYLVPPSVISPVGDREFAHIELSSTVAPFQQTRVEVVARELEESFEEETDTNQVVPLAPSLFPTDNTNTLPTSTVATATAATSILPTLPPEVALPHQTTPQLETSASVSTQLTLVTVTFPTLPPPTAATTTAQGYSERPQQVITARPAPIEPPVFPPGSAPPGPDVTDLPALPTTLPPGTSPLPPAPPTTAEKKSSTYVPQPPVAPPRLPVAPPRISPIPPVAPPVAQRISPPSTPVGKIVSYVPAPVKFEGLVFQTTTRPIVTTTEKKYKENPSIPVESCKPNCPS